MRRDAASYCQISIYMAKKEVEKNNTAKVWKILKTVGIVFEWAIFAVLIATFLIVLSPLLPTKKYIYTYIVATGSMESAIHAGSVAFVKPAETTKLKKGDIITFTSPKDSKLTVLHRIIAVNKSGKEKTFMTKGDNNNSPDSWTISQTMIKGQFLFSVPYLGHIGALIKTPKGFAAIVIFPALILAVLQIKTIKLGIDEEVERRTNQVLEKTKNKKGKALLKNVILLAFILNGLVIYGVSEISRALFVSSSTASGVTFSVKDFVPPPVPTLLSPTNNSYRNTSGLVMDWSDVTDYEDMHNPVYYIYQSARNPGFSPLAYTSGHLSASQIPAPGTPDGEYWWHVKACDTLDNCSDWTPAWKVIVDNTAPPAPTNLLWKKADGTIISCGGATNSYSIIADWDNVIDPFPGQIEKYEYFITYPKLDGTIGTWSTFVISSQYTGVFNAGQGVHTYKVRAYDKTNNISVWSSECSIVYDSVAPSPVSLSITGSYTKAVEEKVVNGGLEDGLNGWTTAGDVDVIASDTIPQLSPEPDLVINPYEGLSMAKIGNYTYPTDQGNKVWENRLMQSISGGAKSLSLHYNYASYDFAPFDDPGFFIRLNGQEVFKLDPSVLDDTDVGIATSSGWQQFYYDLSNYSDSENINLAIYAGNSYDDTRQSWGYVDAITTYFVSAPGHAIYTLSGTDSSSGINHYEYRIGGGSWQQTPSTFQVTEHGDHWVEYKAVDNAGNESLIYRVQIITDTQAPSQITDLQVDEIGANSATLSWTAPGNDGASGKAAKYDIRYSTSPIDLDNFETATSSGKSPVPNESGLEETIEILGLNPSTTYYFAIKAADEAPNWSDIYTTSSTTTPLSPATTVSPGDLIINELMWMGSSVSSADEWIELRNMTDRTIDLTGFKIQKYNGSTYVDMITLPSSFIEARGYYLIANYTPGSSDSQLRPLVTADLVTTSVDLAAGHLQLQLTDSLDNVLDSAWDYTYNLSDGEGEGLYDAVNLKYYSMERTSIPGDGTDPLNWYSCIDAQSYTDFFTVGVTGSDIRGTPRVENRSENEPYNRKLKQTIPPTPTLTLAPTVALDKNPKVILIFSETKDSIGFIVENITAYSELTYKLENSLTKKIIADNSSSEEVLSGQDKYEAKGIILETCSGGVCTKLTDTENLTLTVVLTDKEGKEILLETKP